MRLFLSLSVLVAVLAMVLEGTGFLRLSTK
uniref:Apolipoprotein C1 n=1 Tax=Ailuropoda melanoleuca TaxID=9646 RepID=A0A7N5JTY6_AILME